MSDYRAGYVGIIGLPNAGKSTLVNWLTGEKIAIVTAKPQTTRRRVVGIVSHEKGQIMFVDSPGIVKASRGLNKYLEEECKDIIQNSDALIATLNVDETKFENLEQVVRVVKEASKPWFIVITKSDLKSAEHRIPILREKLAGLNVKILTISAVSKDEEEQELKKEIIEYVTAFLPPSPGPLFDTEIYTTELIRDMTAEIIREECFELLHQELPYGIAIRIKHFVEDDGPTAKIYGEILVAKEGHKPMVIGDSARTIKEIGSRARVKIEKLLDRKVFLHLQVDVKKNWFENPGVLKELGYVVPES